MTLIFFSKYCYDLFNDSQKKTLKNRVLLTSLARSFTTRGQGMLTYFRHAKKKKKERKKYGIIGTIECKMDKFRVSL